MQRFWALLGRCGSGTSSHNGATAPHPDPSYLPPQGIYRLPSSNSASFISDVGEKVPRGRDVNGSSRIGHRVGSTGEDAAERDLPRA